MKKLEIGSRIFDLEIKPLLMGILNITPDSFSDGGDFRSPTSALDHALQMEKDGADIIDIGGESTRPGSKSISLQEELDRVLPVIETIRQRSDIPISIDTWKADVFHQAVNAGANMLNDVSGLTRDPDILKVLQELRLPVTIMHASATPDVMQQKTHYEDLIGEIASFLKIQAKTATEAGATSVIIDPGIGFGKSTEQNLQLIKHLQEFASLGYPVLLGPSRKSYIGNTLGLDVNQRLEATLASAALGIANGANILRLHDVLAGRRAIDMAWLITKA